jgi:hypothetical protein
MWLKIFLVGSAAFSVNFSFHLALAEPSPCGIVTGDTLTGSRAAMGVVPGSKVLAVCILVLLYQNG